jgi:hypothetical protein
MRVLLTIAVAMTSLAVPAMAVEAPAEKKICKRSEEGMTGTNLRRGPSKVCKTAAEWKGQEVEIQRAWREMDEKGVGGGGLTSKAGKDPE